MVGVAVGQLPTMKPTWQMNLSTIVMPCNNSGFTDPSRTAGFGIVDFDWSNSKAQWAKAKPMNDEELLMKQVQMTTEATPYTTVWVYRNVVYAYPWYTSVREILEDPAYEAWFLKFKPEGPWFSPKCDLNYDPPRCSDYYHSQEQTPDYPHGDGDCAAPGCDCGPHTPCGFYLWNHSSDVVVKGQTFQDWFLDSYMFNEVGSSPLVSGFFWDDVWNVDCNIHDQVKDTCEDMGLTKADLQQITDAWNANMAALKKRTLQEKKFAWQMLWTGGDGAAVGNTCPQPIVQQDSCAETLRQYCQADSLPQTRAMMYSFGPGGCKGDPSNLTQFDQDLANFLLIRGDYAWLGHGWLGCSRDYAFPEELHGDYGEPLTLCAETAPGSGVFQRNWTNAAVQMDCNTWTPRIDMIQEQTMEVTV